MCARCLHILEPINNLTSNKIKWKWTDIEDNAFENIRRVVDYNTFSNYTDFNEQFEINTNAIRFKLLAVIFIIQEGRHIIFYKKNC